MKKILVFAICALSLVACNDKKVQKDQFAEQLKDSLQSIITQKDTEINDLMGTLNDIDEGFRLINEAQNNVTVAKAGEGANRKQRIRENVQLIQQTMQKNREMIKKLQNQLKNGTIKSAQLQKMVESMTQQLQEKEQMIMRLREDLDSKDIKISELDETVANLNTDVNSLKEETAQKQEVINKQDKDLHTAWFVFGTKKELKEQRIIDGSRVLQSNFNKNYFTKIDIRVDKEIKLYSKSANLLTAHPASSYKLQKDASGQYVLTITNPEVFWSTSKYLVILVK